MSEIYGTSTAGAKCFQRLSMGDFKASQVQTFSESRADHPVLFGFLPKIRNNLQEDQLGTLNGPIQQLVLRELNCPRKWADIFTLEKKRTSDTR